MEKMKNTAEAADHLGLTPGYVTNLRCWGTGPRWRRVGARNVGYDVADLDSWAAERLAKRNDPEHDHGRHVPRQPNSVLGGGSYNRRP